MQPLYLPLAGPADDAAARRFAILHRPAGAPRSLVVYAHPLAEEMNKSRRMVAQQARALAAAGHAVLLPDLHGCGDSPGDFGDASWSGWVDEIVAAATWLRHSAAASARETGADPRLPPPPLVLWGLRAGALLAAAAAARLGDVPQLLLWQPAPAGRTLLQQFLRLQAAAQLLGRDGSAPAGADALRNRLAAGETVEVAGYRLSPALAQGLEPAKLNPVACVRRVHWLELSQRDTAALSPAAAPVIAAWQQAGCEVQTRVVAGPPFWQTTEIEDAPALLAATLSALDAPPVAADAAVGAAGAPVTAAPVSA